MSKGFKLRNIAAFGTALALCVPAAASAAELTRTFTWHNNESSTVLDTIVVDGVTYRLTGTGPAKQSVTDAVRKTVTETSSGTCQPNEVGSLSDTVAKSRRYDKDGFSGVLQRTRLDKKEIKRNQPKHVSETRTYDVSSEGDDDPDKVPNFIDVSGHRVNRTKLDYKQNGSSWKAVATYSGSWTESVTDHWEWTATYSGTVTKPGVKGDWTQEAYYRSVDKPAVPQENKIPASNPRPRQQAQDAKQGQKRGDKASVASDDPDVIVVFPDTNSEDDGGTVSIDQDGNSEGKSDGKQDADAAKKADAGKAQQPDSGSGDAQSEPAGSGNGGSATETDDSGRRGIDKRLLIGGGAVVGLAAGAAVAFLIIHRRNATGRAELIEFRGEDEQRTFSRIDVVSDDEDNVLAVVGIPDDDISLDPGVSYYVVLSDDLELPSDDITVVSQSGMVVYSGPVGDRQIRLDTQALRAAINDAVQSMPEGGYEPIVSDTGGGTKQRKGRAKKQPAEAPQAQGQITGETEKPKRRFPFGRKKAGAEQAQAPQQSAPGQQMQNQPQSRQTPNQPMPQQPMTPQAPQMPQQPMPPQVPQAQTPQQPMQAQAPQQPMPVQSMTPQAPQAQTPQPMPQQPMMQQPMPQQPMPQQQQPMQAQTPQQPMPQAPQSGAPGNVR